MLAVDLDGYPSTKHFYVASLSELVSQIKSKEVRLTKRECEMAGKRFPKKIRII